MCVDISRLALAGLAANEDEEGNDTPLGKPIAYGWGTPRKGSARRCDEGMGL